MHKIVFLDRMSLIAELRPPNFDHDWVEFDNTQAHETVGRLQGASIAITNKVALGQNELSQLPGLKMIAVAATGVNDIHIPYCREHGIVVSNIRNYAVHAVPEHVFAIVLALRRNLLAYRTDLQQGLWQQSGQFCLFTHPIHDLHGSILGIIGYGALGKAVHKLAEAFGMTVLIAEHKGAASVRPGYVSFEEVLQRSDVITLHTPLTEQTRHMICHREFSLMRPDALLINAARGGLVDETALVQALETGRIAGAGFDVLSNEPPREGNPLLELNSPNFILTPHVAWSSREAMQILADQLIENIEAFVAGHPRNVVS